MHAYDVVVVGGGPAGMMAAGRAAARGRRVVLLEKNLTLGKKLLLTGGGRCNVTNRALESRAALATYKDAGKFLAGTFARWSVADTIEFFRVRGMPMKEEAGGRMFPVSDTSTSVLHVLDAYMREVGVEVRTGVEVTRVMCDGTGVVITGAGDIKLHARICVVATGGVSRTDTGSTGDGFRWLAELGHTIIAPHMALVPIALKDAWVRDAAGVVLSSIRLTTYADGVRQKTYSGNMLCTHEGVSGPVILNMSRDVGVLLKQTSDVVMRLDLFPHLDHGALRAVIQNLLVTHGNKKIKNVLDTVVPPAFVAPLLAAVHIDGETYCHSVRSEERTALIHTMKSIPLHVSHLLGEDKAVVSSGGVSLTEVDFKTMQSLIVPQLYLAGDVLNIDRPSGGYSLQLCWTTGHVAGDNC